MYKNIRLIIFIVIVGCNRPQYQEVMINKTVKVFSAEYHQQAENYTFKWSPPLGPNDENVIFDLKNDMLIFTPKSIGNYEVYLSIEDKSEEIVAKEIFYFKVIPGTTEVSIVLPIASSPVPTTQNRAVKNPGDYSEKKLQVKTIQEKDLNRASKHKHTQSSISNVEYAIQVSAWPSLEEARINQIELIDEGYDAYIQQYYLKNRDEVWYRVRVGKFFHKNKALKVKQHIESFTGTTTWLDILQTK